MSLSKFAYGQFSCIHLILLCFFNGHFIILYTCPSPSHPSEKTFIPLSETSLIIKISIKPNLNPQLSLAGLLTQISINFQQVVLLMSETENFCELFYFVSLLIIEKISRHSSKIRERLRSVINVTMMFSLVCSDCVDVFHFKCFQKSQQIMNCLNSSFCTWNCIVYVYLIPTFIDVLMHDFN